MKVRTMARTLRWVGLAAVAPYGAAAGALDCTLDTVLKLKAEGFTTEQITALCTGAAGEAATDGHALGGDGAKAQGSQVQGAQAQGAQAVEPALPDWLFRDWDVKYTYEGAVPPPAPMPSYEIWRVARDNGSLRVTLFDRNVFGLPGMETSQPMPISSIDVAGGKLTIHSGNRSLGSASEIVIALEQQADGHLSGSFRSESDFMGAVSKLWGQLSLWPKQ